LKLFADLFIFKSKIRPEFGSVLGSSCLTVDELTDAYAHFANEGKNPRTTYIRKVYDHTGKTLEDNTVFYDPYLSGVEKISRMIHFAKQPEEQNISKETSFIISRIMEDVVNHGTAISASDINYRHKKHVGGKTGTTDNYLDAWFVGYSPDIVTGVWVGNDDHGKTLGRSETGGKAALPIWKDFMKRYLEHFPPSSYVQPENVVRVKVNKKTGLLDKEGVDMYFHTGTEPTQTKEDTEILDPSKGMEGMF
jgi:penicillin-binding protein 1A